MSRLIRDLITTIPNLYSTEDEQDPKRDISFSPTKLSDVKRMN